MLLLLLLLFLVLMLLLLLLWLLHPGSLLLRCMLQTPCHRACSLH